MKPTLPFSACALACVSASALAAPHDGLLEGGDWSLLSRNYFLQTDYRTQPSPSGQSLREEWAQGFIADIRSGFTQGTLGLGFDAHAFLGVKLDGGRYRTVASRPGSSSAGSAAGSRYAIAATSAKWRPRVGVPRTDTRELATSRSSGAASRACAAIRTTLSRSSLAAACAAPPAITALRLPPVPGP